MVEPIFEKTSFEITAGKPATFTQASGDSGKRVTINFCAACGTKLYLDLNDFRQYTVSMAANLMTRTGSTARLK